MDQAQVDPRVERVWRSKYLHAFEFKDAKVAYLPQTGDVLHLDEAAFDAIRMHQSGLRPQRIRCAVEAAWGRPALRQVLSDLRALRSLGYLSSHPREPGDDEESKLRALMQQPPRNLMLLVTEACNLRCTYCYETPNGVHDRAWTMKSALARDVVDAYLRDTAGRKRIAITFFGGEPLLNFPLVREVVAHASAGARALGKEIGFSMTTNLTRMTPEVADFLCEHQFTVMVSMDGPEEVQDSQRPTKGGEGSYEVVARNLRSLLALQRERGVRPAKIRATLSGSDWNPLEIEKALWEFEPHDVILGEDSSSLAASEGKPGAGAESGCSRATPDDVWERHIDEFVEDLNAGRKPSLSPALSKSLAKIGQELQRKHIANGDAPKICGVCRNMKAVSANGDYFPCHRYVGMDGFKIGNVNEGLERERVERYYRDIFQSYLAKCQHCWARMLCSGECAWQVSAEDGSIGVPDEDLCQERRRGFEMQLGLFSYLLRHFPEFLRSPIGTSPRDGAPTTGAMAREGGA